MADFTLSFQGSFTEARTTTYRLHKKAGSPGLWVKVAAPSEWGDPVGATPSTFNPPNSIDDTWDLDGDGDENDLPLGARGCRYLADGPAAAPVVNPEVDGDWDPNGFSGFGTNGPTQAQKDATRVDTKPDGYNPDGDKYGIWKEIRTTTWRIDQKYKRDKNTACSPTPGDGSGNPPPQHSLTQGQGGAGGG